MTLAESALETARAVFMAHREGCLHCKRMAFHDTKSLSMLCFRGVSLYKALLKAEDVIITRMNAAEKSKDTRRLRREQYRQLEKMS